MARKSGKRKKPIDPRHQRRRKAIKALFAYSFNEEAKRKRTAPACALALEAIDKVKKIDAAIIKAAPKWPIEKINRIDLAILRLAVWELLFSKKVPPKVAIDEAIELAKEFGADNSSSFVNGVLGTIYNKINKKDERPRKKSKSKI